MLGAEDNYIIYIYIYIWKCRASTSSAVKCCTVTYLEAIVTHIKSYNVITLCGYNYLIIQTMKN